MLGSTCLRGQERCQRGHVLPPGNQGSPGRWDSEKQFRDVIFSLSWCVEVLTKGRKRKVVSEGNKPGPTSAPIRSWETMKNSYSKYGQLEAASGKARAEVRLKPGKTVTEISLAITTQRSLQS